MTISMPPARRGLPRWTNHIAIWVMLGGASALGQCRRRAAIDPGVRWDRAPLRGEGPLVAVEDLGRAADRDRVRHVIGL